MIKKILREIFLFLILPLRALAQNPVILPNPLCPEGSPNCPTGSNIYGIVEKIVNWLAGIGAILAVGMIIWGAIQMITAGGDPEKITKAKRTILWTVVGYAIILIGWGIETIIKKLLTP